MQNFKIHVIDVANSSQNYIWLIEDRNNNTVVIDPTESACVVDYCATHQLQIKQIWFTHWHKDHTGGVSGLLEVYQVPVYGPIYEQQKIPMITHALSDGDYFKFADLSIEVIYTPGHTLGHICYYISAIESAFVGDTLFALGCGRVFEGTHQQMFNSLQRLSALPISTKIYCAHEYTLSNAKFALTIEPHNLLLQQRAEHIENLRLLNQVTLPSTLSIELETNPFLRVESVNEFSHIRTLKDQF
ncbi:hydroxyacylglutathione hydrolase [Acinetobacter rathckeae]|uniref:hydroxyacylglutathione hydrolase n=1 Tax=Acinetobacter rathckeae TaxID=2605272 RepID=UPI0018A2B603|nr:hydroxyacylglutathione hydrolase [Acinetobacter rathckeae]MBF7687605.1 hydroxyacylglutathione hydrolase [Acinetobacter rathckeae]MBF7695007.1 hydroxyacylglutathione hydrolase [Acinetobacter rathckeae]